jgi:beta-1,4-N-acetylglucosaminyltransferase
MKLLLISSSGGHFAAMQRLSPFWLRHTRTWVTFHSPSTEQHLVQETVYWAYGPTNRHFGNLLRNLWLAVWILPKERPDIVLTTGAGVAVPFLWLAKLLGSRGIFVESLTRVTELSLSARLVLPCAEVYVQWSELQTRYPKTKYIGALPL